MAEDGVCRCDDCFKGARCEKAIDTIHGQITLPNAAEPLVVRWADAPGSRRRDTREKSSKRSGTVGCKAVKQAEAPRVPWTRERLLHHYGIPPGGEAAFVLWSKQFFKNREDEDQV